MSFRGVFLLLAVALSASANAHQIKSALTTVLFNRNSGNLEVMHRFYLHDAEHAVSVLVDGKADIIANTQTQQQFADYVTERFAISQNGITMPLNNVGFEVEGKFLWVYQDALMPDTVEQLEVKHSAMQDIWPDQINTVNIEGVINGNKALKTLTFRESGKLLEVSFP